MAGVGVGVGWLVFYFITFASFSEERVCKTPKIVMPKVRVKKKG